MYIYILKHVRHIIYIYNVYIYNIYIMYIICIYSIHILSYYWFILSHLLDPLLSCPTRSFLALACFEKVKVRGGSWWFNLGLVDVEKPHMLRIKWTSVQVLVSNLWQWRRSSRIPRPIMIFKNESPNKITSQWLVIPVRLHQGPPVITRPRLSVGVGPERFFLDGPSVINTSSQPFLCSVICS